MLQNPGNDMPRKFYLIGHNPNNVQDAVAYLQAGANALEPDVCYDKGSKTFYVHDEVVDFLPSWLYSGPTLMSYLDNLVQALRGNQSLQLALISFDLKAPYSYDINAQLYDTIRTHFSQFFPKVSILTTVGKSKGMSFLAQVSPQHPNEAVGVDGGTTPDDVRTFFQTRGLHVTYANGTTFTPVTWIKGSIVRAIQLRDQTPGGIFKLVYVWTVISSSHMQFYLDMGVDGIITGNVASLSNLIKTQYSNLYVLATQDDSPFA
jgi:hypothetical protein